MTLEPTTILIIVLVAVAIWAVVELALTIRKARTSLIQTLVGVDETIASVNETLEQVQPIVGKLDGTMDDLQPAIKEVHPLIERVETTVDVATVSLAKVNDILGDVSEVSGSAASVSATVKNVTSNAANNMAGAVGRFSRNGQGRDRDAAKLGDGNEPRHERKAHKERKESAPIPESGYVTYVAAPASTAEELSASDEAPASETAGPEAE